MLRAPRIGARDQRRRNRERHRGFTMFDDLEDQMKRGDKSSKKLLLYQAGGLLVALGVFALLGWAMMTYSG
jgi:hypothetical protein